MLACEPLCLSTQSVISLSVKKWGDALGVLVEEAGVLDAMPLLRITSEKGAFTA